MKKALLACLGTAVVAGSVGILAGYAWAKNELTVRFDMELSEELEKAREAYARKYKSDEFEDIEVVAEKLLPKRVPQDLSGELDDSTWEMPPNVTDADLQRAVEKLGYQPKETPEAWENQDVVVTTPPTGEDTMTDRDEPYVISVEVFKAGEKSYNTPQLFYYKGNNILTDENNEVIDIADHIGLETVNKFGHGSNDPDFVYVRNDILECDFEVERKHEEFVI